MDKVILITGASSGIGEGIARELAGAGAKVMLGARRTERLDAIATEIRATGGMVETRALDVTDRADVQAFAQAAVAAFGRIDVLVNNAGVMPLSPLSAGKHDEWERMVDVNIKGVYHVVRAFLPAMLERQQGVVVNFSSGWGRSTSPEVAPYCATKWAIEGMTQALADELPAGLAAIPLNPGIIHTEMLDSCFGEHAAAYPSAEQWASSAVPFLLNLSSKDNGNPLTAPG